MLLYSLIITFAGTSVGETIDGVPHERVDFEKLLRESDFVIICAALNESTRHAFNESAFAQMKPDAILVNTSR